MMALDASPTPRPRVTALLMTYNHAEFVARSIDSVLAQDYPSEQVEVIVVDDGSTDGTSEVVRSYGDRVRSIRKPNGGLLSSVNCGLELATGDFIALQSGDDIWLPNKLRSLTKVLEARPEVGLVYGDMQLIDRDDNLMHPSFMSAFGLKPHRGRVLGRLVRHNFVSGGALMVRSSLLPRFHPLPPHAGWEDWWIAVRIAEVAEIEFVPVAVHGYRQHGANMNLGADAAQRAKLVVAELPFRRWVLTDVQADGLAADDLAIAFQGFAHAAQLAAAQAGCGIDQAVGVTDRDRALSGESLRSARSLLAAPDLTGAVRETVRALGLHPENGDALELLKALLAQVSALIRPTSVEFKARSFVTFAAAEELIARPGLLGAYAQTFDGAADATLLIGLPADSVSESVERLTGVVAELGLDSEDSADMVATIVRRDDHAGLLPRLDATLGAAPLDGPLRTLIRADEHSLAGLGRWRASIRGRAQPLPATT